MEGQYFVVNELSADNKKLNELIQNFPPVFMRIPERSPTLDGNFHQVIVKLIDSVQEPTPYPATHARLTFLGFSTPGTKIAIYLDKYLIRTFPFEDVKITNLT